MKKLPRRRRKRSHNPGLEPEQLEAFKAKRMRGLEQRQRDHSGPAMAAHDSLDRLVRCLFTFYGNRVVTAGAMNPQDVPKKLGQAEEFWAEWERWKEIGRAEREVVEQRERAVKADAMARFAELF